MIVLASPLYYWTITDRIKAFIERTYAFEWRSKSLKKESALLMTAAQDSFWTFEQAVSYYQINCIKFMKQQGKGMILAGNCCGVTGKRQIANTGYLEPAYQFGKSL